MNDYRTMPNPALRQSRAKQINLPSQLAQTQKASAVQHISRQVPQSRNRRPAKSRSKSKRFAWLLLIPTGLIVMLMLAIVGGFVVLQLSFANTILPRVSVAGLSLGGLTPEEASQVLPNQWDTIQLTDGSQTWDVDPMALGIVLDTERTVADAFAQGHGEGGFAAIFNDVDITPSIAIDVTTMNNQLAALAPSIETAAVDAGVAFDNGQVSATEPIYGAMIDIQATISALQNNPAILTDGTLDLVMLDVAPQILDSSALVAQAEALLSSPFDIRVFDPVTGDSAYWSALPDEWASWLTASSDPSSPVGLSLSANPAGVSTYLEQQVVNYFDSTRTLDFDAAIASIQQSLAAGQVHDVFVTVQHSERIHTVQAGESITSIAWDYGIPYLYIMQANNGLESVSIGQQITIPPADFFLDGNVNPNKRIVVSISQQRTYVYENDQLIYEWVSSTGIADSPTWTGIYQILSHEPNAYAGNWNLYMPNFMGVYQPVPGSAFTNGFHGFPTRGGGQLLWENNLGTRVTYGCILLSDQHIQILYDWAEEGVIVEIQA